MPNLPANTTTYESAEAFFAAAEALFHEEVAKTIGPFNVLIVAGAAGTGKTTLVRNAVAGREQVLFVEAPNRLVNLDLSTMSVPKDGAIVLDEVMAYESDSLREGLAAMAQLPHAGEHTLLLVLIVQRAEDLLPFADLLPDKLLLIDLLRKHGLTVELGSREDVLYPARRANIPKLAFVGAEAEQMFTQAIQG